MQTDSNGELLVQVIVNVGTSKLHIAGDKENPAFMNTVRLQMAVG